MNVRACAAWVLAAGLALALGTGCEDPKAKDEEIARLNAIILATNKENKDLMAQVENANVRVKQAELAVAGKERELEALRAALARLRNSVVLTDKVRTQLELLAKKFGGRLVGNRLELPGDYFFGSGDFALRTNSRSMLKQVADILKDEKNLTLLIVGHTDADPIKHSASKGIRSNRHLSMMRALSVLDELKKDGYPDTLMYPTGWGELFPMDTSGSKVGKAMNRRVDILIDPAASGLFSAVVGITDIGPAPAPGGATEAPATGGDEGGVTREE